MAPLAEAFVRIRPDVSGFEKEAKAGVGKAGAGIAKEGDRHGKAFGARFTGGIAGSFKGLAGSLAGSFAAFEAVNIFKGFITDARESQRIGRITAQVITSTGGAAKISAKQVGDLATAISNKTGADDEAIQSGENLLLTFTNIRNETGKGNDIFNRASQAVTDMTAALNNGQVTTEGVKASSIQLGKALNDPIKGVTALQRVGVSFTASQKEQIKTLVESGNTLGAQKIILAEVGKEFGGAARAASDPMQRLKVIAGNLGEQVGTALLPALDKFASFLTGTAIPAVSKMVGFFQRNQNVIKPLVVVLTGLAVGIAAVSAATKVYAAVQALLNVVLTANPIGIVIVAVAALTAGVIYAYKHSETFRKIVDGTFRFIAASGKSMWESFLRPAFTAISAAFVRIMAGTNAMRLAFAGATKAIIGVFLNMVGTVINGAARALGWIPGIGPKLKDAAKAFNRFRDDVNNSLAGVKNRSVAVTASLRGIDVRSFVGMAGPSRVGGLWSGGRIPGPDATRDNMIVPMRQGGAVAVASGEYVMPVEKTRRFLPVLEAMRDGRFRMDGYAAGGLVTRGQFPSQQAIDKVGATFDAKVAGTAARVAQGLKNFFASFGGPGIAGALRWVRSQAGKPYIWGGVGPRGFDCSGLMSAIINVIRGRNPYRRLFATGSMPAGGLVEGARSPFMVGWFRGSPGHTAGTLGGVNVESRGGRGVVVGRGARGWSNSLFNRHAGLRAFAGGGLVGDGPFDYLDPRGRSFLGADLRALLAGARVFDGGGPWPPGTLGVNRSGKTETVVPGDGRVRLHPEDLRALARALESRPVVLTLDGRQIDSSLGRRANLYGRGG